MRVHRGYRMASRENYLSYCRDYPDKKISYYDWANIIYTFNYNFRDYLLETGEIEHLPYGTLHIAISKRKMKSYKMVQGKKVIGLPVNWEKWKETGKIYYFTNDDTGGYRFKWKWFREKSHLYCAHIWNFIPYRVTSRMLTHFLKQEEYQYKYQEW